MLRTVLGHDQHTVAATYARWDGVGLPFTLVDTTTPAEPAPGEVLVRIDLATVCGNIAHADSANDHPAVMLAYRAEVVAEGPNGRRTIPIDYALMKRRGAAMYALYML